MFKNIVAIDVSSSIPNFNGRLKEYYKGEAIIADKADSLTLTKDQAALSDGLLVSIYEQINEKLLKQLPALRYIGVLGTSTKKIDLAYCEAKNIKVASVKEYCDEETAEWVILQILKFFRERKEPKSAFGKTLGIIGFGSVGKKLAHKAQGLGLKVLVNTLSKQETKWENASKEKIFAESDIISFHTPPHTPWLLKEELKHAKQESLIINTCFGAVDKNNELKNFLSERSDVTLVMDRIAFASYDQSGIRASSFKESAYDTKDANARLIQKFFELLRENALK